MAYVTRIGTPRDGRAVLAWLPLVLTGLLAGGHVTMADSPGVYSVCDYGAVGDGKAADTAAINKAIEACAAAGGGQVRLPPGTYLSGTVHLKSNVTLWLDAGSRLVGSTDLEHYQHFTAPAGTPEAGSPKWHRALVLGVGVENVAIAGKGVIDGNKVFDPHGEEKMRGPHTIILGNCRDVQIRDVTIRDSANYAILIEFSDRVDVRQVKVTGGWDGVHFRGWSDRPCRDLTIVGCEFFTGDDSIAGRYVENLLVSDCVINSSCNGLRIIGPMKHMVVNNCLFYGPGVHPHRTQDRHNMLCGIFLQPGGWDVCEGPLEDVLISDVTMKNVASPVMICLRRPGNTADGITVTRLTATGVYRAAASVEARAGTPVGRVVFRDVSIEYAGGGKKPSLDARGLSAWGFYAHNVRDLRFEDVRLSCAKDDLRPVLIGEGVARLRLDNLRFPRVTGAADPLVLKDVGRIEYGREAAPPRAK